jgi:histone-lysine N-methyltransferase SETDB1
MLPQQNVTIEDDPGFLVSCDCTDNCSNRKKCSCIQLTVQVANSLIQE